jgi:hypothetical protein
MTLQPPRYCQECQRRLSADSRADIKFCSSTCRSRTHRSQRLRMAGNVCDWLGGRMWVTGAGIDRLGELLTRRMSGVELWRPQVEQLMPWPPDVRERSAHLGSHPAPGRIQEWRPSQRSPQSACLPSPADPPGMRCLRARSDCAAVIGCGHARRARLARGRVRGAPPLAR